MMVGMAKNNKKKWRVEVENIEVHYGSFEGPAHRARCLSEYSCDLLLDGVKAATVEVGGEY